MIVLFKQPSTKEKVHFQIQQFLLKKSASFVQILEVCNAPKETVDKYLDELVKLGNIVLKPKRKQGIEKYALTTKGTDVITLLLEKQKVKTQIEEMSPERFEQFKKFVDFLGKSKKGDEFVLQVADTEFSKKIKKFKNLGTTLESKGWKFSFVLCIGWLDFYSVSEMLKHYIESKRNIKQGNQICQQINQIDISWV